MIYKLAPHVTEEMLVEMGFELFTKKQGYNYDGAIRLDTLIPLEKCEDGERVIQSVYYGIEPEEHDYASIQDLIEKGMVICE